MLQSEEQGGTLKAAEGIRQDEKSPPDKREGVAFDALLQVPSQGGKWVNTGARVMCRTQHRAWRSRSLLLCCEMTPAVTRNQSTHHCVLGSL